MKIDRDIILGISPGTRYIGLAVLRNGEIIDWRLKCFNGKWSKRKLLRITHIIGSYITDYGITKAGIKESQTVSANVEKVRESIILLCKMREIKYLSRTSKEEVNRQKCRLILCNPLFTLLKEKQNKNIQYVRVKNAIIVAYAIHKKLPKM